MKPGQEEKKRSEMCLQQGKGQAIESTVNYRYFATVRIRP
jgi:hypothetical protein